jgi:hypothetical protein
MPQGVGDVWGVFVRDGDGLAPSDPTSSLWIIRADAAAA